MLAICLIFIFVCCSQEAHYQHNININATLSTSNINKNNISPPHAGSKTSEIFTDWHTGPALGTELMHQSGRFSSSSLTDMINSNYPTFFSSVLHPTEARLRNWNIFLEELKDPFNCKYFSAETRSELAIWSMIMRSIFSLDDIETQYPWRQYIKPHMWPFVLNFSRSKYFQTSLNIFNLFQSSLFDKYFLLPSRYQYSPGANFYIKFSLTALRL